MDREPAAEQRDVDPVDADRSLRERVEPGDRQMARDRRQGIEHRRNRDQQDGRDHDEPATGSHLTGAPRDLSMPTVLSGDYAGSRKIRVDAFPDARRPGNSGRGTAPASRWEHAGWIDVRTRRALG